MNQLQEAVASTKSIAKLSRSSKLFKTIIKAIEEKKGERVISLNLRKIHEAVADFFIICEATTSTQVKAIADNIQHLLKETCDEMAFKSEGYSNSKWILIDYVNIVVHIMQPESRQFYKLEEMWSDAPLVEHIEKID